MGNLHGGYSHKGMKKRIELKASRKTGKGGELKGASGEFEVCCFFLNRGYQVFRNVCNDGPDLIVRREGRSRVVEVKHGSVNNGTLQYRTPCNVCDYVFYIFPEKYLLVVVETNEKKWFERPTLRDSGVRA